MPDIHPLIDAEYTPYDVGVMGEFDVRILDRAVWRARDGGCAGPGVEWRRLLCGATQVGGDGGGEGVDGVDWADLLLAVEESRIRRGRFCTLCANRFARKYSNVAERKKDEADEKEQVYSTNEGDVLISISGTGVFVGEGFDLALARKLRDRIVERAVGCAVADAGGRAIAGTSAVRWRVCLRRSA